MIEFAYSYITVLNMALRCGKREINQRTGSVVSVIPRAIKINIDLSNNILPVPGIRHVNLRIPIAETAWMILGHPHIDWLRKYTKIWDQFAELQDCPSCEGEGKCSMCLDGKVYWLQQGYGWRMRAAFGFDQLEMALCRLRHNPSDRRIWISLWRPEDDLEFGSQKTVPCPVGFTLQIIDGALHSSLMIRSSDLWHGLPHDVIRHSLFMAAVASDLNVKLGMFCVTLANAHLYDNQIEVASVAVREPVLYTKLEMPKYDTLYIKNHPDQYVHDLMEYVKTLEWPGYNPKVEVVP